MIGLANDGGEMHVKHDELAGLMGQCRRNVIRVLRRLVDKGLLTVGPRYRWVLKLSTRGKPYRMKMRLPNVYRIATRFLSALKKAGKLIRPWWKRNVTAEKPSRSREGDLSLSAGVLRFQMAAMEAACRVSARLVADLRQQNRADQLCGHCHRPFDAHETEPEW
jgi:hypothetical protein